MHDDQPLAGRLVLDMTQGIAGPYCGRLLAEHGARVIKLEPPQGDWIRKIGGGPGGQSVNYLYYNLGKEAVVLDLKTPDGLASALAIASRADVVLESARPRRDGPSGHRVRDRARGGTECRLWVGFRVRSARTSW